MPAANNLIGRQRGALDDILSWFQLKSVPGVGNLLFKRLVDRFGTPGAALSATRADLLAVEAATPTDDPARRALYNIALNQALEFGSAIDRLKAHGRELLTQDNVRRLIEVYRYRNGAYPADLASLGADAPVRTLLEIIEFNERNADLEWSVACRLSVVGPAVPFDFLAEAGPERRRRVVGLPMAVISCWPWRGTVG